MQDRRRVITSLLMVVAVLFVSIYLGVTIGDRIRGLATVQATLASTLPTPVPEEESSRAPLQSGWKHIQVVVAATDPAFPDPRITPTPQPPPPPPPSRQPAVGADPFNNPPAPNTAAPPPSPGSVPAILPSPPVLNLVTSNPMPIATPADNAEPTPDDLGN